MDMSTVLPARFDKVRRHPAAHGAETEIGNCLYHIGIRRRLLRRSKIKLRHVCRVVRVKCILFLVVIRRFWINQR